MAFAVAAVGLLILGLGALGLVRPGALIGLVERAWRSRSGLYLAVAIRVGLGVLFLAAASDTRFPGVVGALGVLNLAAAAVAPLLGYERLRRFVGWWAERPGGFVRGWSVVAAAFGGFLIYAAV